MMGVHVHENPFLCPAPTPDMVGLVVIFHREDARNRIHTDSSAYWEIAYSFRPGDTHIFPNNPRRPHSVI